MKTYLYSLIVVLLFSCELFGQTADEQYIRQLSKEQTISWNKGDIEQFMIGYWNNDSLLFVGKSGPKYGYHTTLENYRKNYPDTVAMGTLRFDLLQMKRLSALYYFVVGKFHLRRSIGDLEGHFTLLFKKLKGKWVIVADHSS